MCFPSFLCSVFSITHAPPFLFFIASQETHPRGLTRSAASAVIVDSPDGVLPVPCTSLHCLPTGTASDSTMSGPGRLGVDARGPVVRRLRLLFPGAGAGAGERHEIIKPVSKLRQPKQPKPRRCPPHRQTTAPTSWSGTIACPSGLDHPLRIKSLSSLKAASTRSSWYGGCSARAAIFCQWKSSVPWFLEQSLNIAQIRAFIKGKRKDKVKKYKK